MSLGSPGGELPEGPRGRCPDRLGIGYVLQDYEVDEQSVELHDRVAVSAGVRGTQILIAPADYLRATGARLGPIARAPS